MHRPGGPIDQPRATLSRRRLLRLTAAAATAGYLSARLDAARSVAKALIGDSPSGPVSQPAATTSRLLYRSANLADGRSASLGRNMSVLVTGGRISWIRPRDA